MRCPCREPSPHGKYTCFASPKNGFSMDGLRA